MSRPVIDLTNKKFNRWSVISKAKSASNGNTKWLCKCDCGTIKEVRSDQLRNGHSISCGCYKIERVIGVLTIHGASKNGIETPEYISWKGMKRRCENRKDRRFKDYGGRGIKVCDRWLNSFENFLADMGKKPFPDSSLDRFPNNDGDYEPSNCKWSSPKEQGHNRRTNRWFEYEGTKMILSDWARQFGVRRQILGKMLKHRTFKEAYDYYQNKKVA